VRRLNSRFHKHKIKLLVLSCLLSSSISVDAKQFGDLELSGFGRLVAGHLNQDNVVFNGYGNRLTNSADSLIALRADYGLNDSLSVVGQVLAHTDDDRASGIQWLYADYRPTADINVKVGRQRIPFYNYSDIVDVGFAYPYARLPDAVYSQYFFAEFDGALTRWSFSTPNFSGSLEAYYGVFEGTVYIASTKIEADVEYVYGTLATANIDNFSFRASYHTGKVDAQNEDLTPLIDTFNQFGFAENARSLEIKGRVQFYQFSGAYETVDYFARAEFTYMTPNDDMLIVPSLDAFYVTAGYNYYPFTVHLTYSENDVTYRDPTNQIPRGVSLALDQLAFVYDNIFENRPIDQIKAIALGLRYDVNANVALKFEVAKLRGTKGGRAFFDELNPSSDRPKGVLTQAVLEWVF